MSDYYKGVHFEAVHGMMRVGCENAISRSIYGDINLAEKIRRVASASPLA